MNNFESTQMTVAQIDVVPGRPDINAPRIIREIELAKDRGDSLIIFPEMAVPGYMLGDEWDNKAFVRDCVAWNDDIVAATQGITAIWGNVQTDEQKINEDGRIRKYNAAFVASDGALVDNGAHEGWTTKTLHPKYREFEDSRHFFSTLQLAREEGIPVEDLLQPFEIMIGGVRRKVGVILCEDMWSDDYQEIDPIEILVQNGAEMIIDLSCSPWTLGKNNKRHRVVQDRLEKAGIPLIYANNVGTQNNGKNEFGFDGASAAYDTRGRIVAQLEEFGAEGHLTVNLEDLAYSEDHTLPEAQTDLEKQQELYTALVYTVRKFFEPFNPKRAVIGLSGGIDSALNACILADAIGPENVYAVNLPTKNNSDQTKDAAAELAQRLGINYAIMPIQESVDLKIEQFEALEFINFGPAHENPLSGFDMSGLTYENIQARERGSGYIMALASTLGGVMINNGNKTELAFGYATMYGDLNGAIAPTGDLLKGEVYDMARQFNAFRGAEILPQEIIDMIPSAELSPDQNIDEGKGDPFEYVYHDELVRAFVVWRRDPEDILQSYIDGQLAERFGIDPDLIDRLFPTPADFLADLKDKWKRYRSAINVFKRGNTAPPIITVSPRSFGFDLRESRMSPHFTRQFQRLEEVLLNAA